MNETTQELEKSMEGQIVRTPAVVAAEINQLTNQTRGNRMNDKKTRTKDKHTSKHHCIIADMKDL